MSNMLKALEASQQGFQAAQAPQPAVDARPVAQKKASKLLCLALFSLPLVVAGAAFSYKFSLQQQSLYQASLQRLTDYQQLDTSLPSELTPLELLLAKSEQKEPAEGSDTGASDGVNAVVITDNRAVKPEPKPPAQVKQDQELNLDQLDLSGLSPELAQRFQQALGEAQQAGDSPQQEQVEPQPVVKLVEHLSDYRGKLPALNLQTHMYASSADRRWVKINDTELSEGEWLSPQVQLLTISVNSVVIGFGDEQIELPALYEWKG